MRERYICSRASLHLEHVAIFSGQPTPPQVSQGSTYNENEHTNLKNKIIPKEKQVLLTPPLELVNPLCHRSSNLLTRIKTCN